MTSRNSRLRYRHLAPVAVIALTFTPLTACSESAQITVGEVAVVEADRGGAPAVELESAAEVGGITSFDQIAQLDPLSPVLDAREVITNGFLTLSTTDPIATAEEVAQFAEQAGGWVENRQEMRPTPDFPGSAFLTLRVPAPSLSQLMSALGQFGEITNVSVNRQDVTATARDLDARIEALDSSTARLSELMANADTVSDLLEAEVQLTQRQAELDSLRQSRADITGRVTMSTLEVQLNSNAIALPRTGIGFLGGLRRGWESLGVFGQWFVVALGTLLPWLLILGLIIVPCIVLWRKRRAERAGSSSLLRLRLPRRVVPVAVDADAPDAGEA